MVGGDAWGRVDDGGARAYSGPPEPVGQVRARLVSAHGWADLRGPSACEVITPGEAGNVVARLGPDPLVAGTGPGEFLERLSRRSVALGQLLMDQSVIAGIGNVFRAEALFACGQHPSRPAASRTSTWPRACRGGRCRSCCGPRWRWGRATDRST